MSEDKTTAEAVRLRARMRNLTSDFMLTEDDGLILAGLAASLLLKNAAMVQIVREERAV